MKAQPTLSILKPCTQQWANMQPNQHGRFCSSCQKSVIDLSSLSNSEILAMLASSSQICGRISENQLYSLNEQIQTPQRSFSWKRMGIAVALVSFLSIIKAEARVIMPKAAYHQTLFSKKIQATADSNEVYQKLTGKIVDDNNELIAGAIIKIKGTQVATMTTQNGEFAINIPAHKKVTLVISFIGYKTMEVKLRPGYNRKLNVKLKMQVMMLGGLAAIRSPKSNSLWTKLTRWT
jgi:hypothetical protein